MTASLFLAVAIGGFVGAPCRYIIDRILNRRVGSELPWGTFTVNVSGAFVFGLLSGLALSHHLSPFDKALLGTGFCGAFTTFSTFTFETVRLLEDGQLVEAVINVASSLVVGLAAASAGVAIGLAI